MSEFRFDYLLNAVMYSSLGILLFAIAFLLLAKLLPCDLWKEICEQRNTALAILVGAISIGICLIIAAAAH